MSDPAIKPEHTQIQGLWEKKDGNFFFQAGNQLFLLDPGALSRGSEFFTTMLGIQQPKGAEPAGRYEHSPIKVAGPAEANPKFFEIYACLTHAVPPDIPRDLPFDVELLQYSRYLGAPNLRLLALKSIKTCGLYNIGSPALLIHVCFEYGTKEPFSRAFDRLLETPWSDMPPLETTKIPIHVYDVVSRLKEAMDLHMRRVASEPPLLKPHPSTCPDRIGCVDDWEASWWLHMGKLLLNGVEPLIWSEALERFKKIPSFGRVAPSCQEALLTIVDNETGYLAKYPPIFHIREVLEAGIPGPVDE
ncbi:hypothetical protein C8J56DRAFT_860988, partial [Mycena floridula]